jgi:hypothetical protein
MPQKNNGKKVKKKVIKHLKEDIHEAKESIRDDKKLTKALKKKK